MKKITDNSVQEFNSFEILSENEMMEVRGGGRPKTREIDVFIEEGEE